MQVWSRLSLKLASCVKSRAAADKKCRIVVRFCEGLSRSRHSYNGRVREAQPVLYGGAFVARCCGSISAGRGLRSPAAAVSAEEQTKKKKKKKGKKKNERENGRWPEADKEVQKPKEHGSAPPAKTEHPLRADRSCPDLAQIWMQSEIQALQPRGVFVGAAARTTPVHCVELCASRVLPCDGGCECCDAGACATDTKVPCLTHFSSRSSFFCR